MLGAVVLAAGASSRMGRPKALLEFDGVPAIERVCAALVEGGCDRVIAVLGADADAIEPAVPSGVEVVRHDAWQDGRTSSVKVGLEVLLRTDAVLIAPVDRPLFTPTDVKTLAQSEKPLAVPAYDGKTGHPLLVRRDVYDEIMALSDEEPLNQVVYEDEDRVDEVPTENPGVLVNLDTPEDYEAAKDVPRRWAPA